MLNPSVLSSPPNNCSPITQWRSPPVESTVTNGNQVNRQAGIRHNHDPAPPALYERNVARIHSQEPEARHQHYDVFSELMIPWNDESPCLPQQSADQENDIDSLIVNGRHDKLSEFLQHNNINTVADCKDHPLVTAICYGSLDTALFLLKHGANPNITYTSHRGSGILSIDHILKQATDIPRIILLLSYGADPFNDRNYEMVFAKSDQRITHLLVYYYWDLYRQRHSGPIPRPDSVSALNKLAMKLPILTITSIISLFDSYQLSLSTPPENPPKKKLLKAFFDFITN